MVTVAEDEMVSVAVTAFVVRVVVVVVVAEVP
jgi:hypothetical protein